MSMRFGLPLMILPLLAASGAGAYQRETPVIADNSINYVELRATDMVATKRFYSEAFGWDWIDYGPAYAAITGAGLDGGVRLDEENKDPSVRPPIPSSLVILYAHDLEASQERVRKAGGEILKPIFPFPGGRRFHFLDPAGNELAVWSDAGVEAE